MCTVESQTLDALTSEACVSYEALIILKSSLLKVSACAVEVFDRLYINIPVVVELPPEDRFDFSGCVTFTLVVKDPLKR